MTTIDMKKLGKLSLMGIFATSGMALGACSTTSGTMANGAPISYKVDQGQFQQASISKPYASLMPQKQYSAPRRAALPTKPKKYMPSLPKQSAPKASKFDQSSVDTDLYKHQRIGKRYTIMGKSYTPKHQPHYNKVGTASWYGDKFHGKPTATGELYDMDDITAAHKTLPLNSMVYVTNLETGKGLMVRVNDRGPFVDGRIIDLSRASARRLGMFTSGLGRVRVQYAGPADPMAAKTNKKPIKRLSTPQLKYEPSPELIVEAPKVSPKLLPKRLPQLPLNLTPEYKPLREFGNQLKQKLATPPAAQASLPTPKQPKATQPHFPFQPKAYSNPLLGESNPVAQPLQNAPQSVQVPNTQPSMPQGDGPVTLTIKGPIHMATDKNDEQHEKAKFIPAVNYTHIPAGK